MRHIFAGLYTALVTPMSEGKVDLVSLRRLLRHQLDNGVEGFVINGTTAESPTLNHKERNAIFELVNGEVSGSVPLIFGAGTFCTETSIELIREGEKLGANGLLLVTPYYNKPPQRGLVMHFKALAQATELPVLLYNVPSRTITELSAETVEALSGVSNIVGIKDASGDIAFGTRLKEKCGPEFLVTSGDDATCMQLAEKCKGGVISVLSHLVPGPMRKLLDLSCGGDSLALQQFEKYNKLTTHLFVEANPIPVKAALKLMGIIDCDELRLPLCAAEEGLRRILKIDLEELGLL